MVLTTPTRTLHLLQHTRPSLLNLPKDHLIPNRHPHHMQLHVATITYLIKKLIIIISVLYQGSIYT